MPWRLAVSTSSIDYSILSALGLSGSLKTGPKSSFHRGNMQRREKPARGFLAGTGRVLPAS